LRAHCTFPDAEELLSFAVVGIDVIGLASKPAGAPHGAVALPDCGHHHLHLAERRMLDCRVSSSVPAAVVKVARGEDGRGATGPLEAHSPGRRQRATIQHVAIGVHRCKGGWLLIGEGPGCGCG
jgi:hypothetical protein